MQLILHTQSAFGQMCIVTLNEFSMSRVKVISDHAKIKMFKAHLLSPQPYLAHTPHKQSFGQRVFSNLKPSFKLECEDHIISMFIPFIKK